MPSHGVHANGSQLTREEAQEAHRIEEAATAWYRRHLAAMTLQDRLAYRRAIDAFARRQARA